MKLILPALAVLALATATQAAEPKTISNIGLEGSESARYDAASDRWVVGNLGPRGPENNGFIALVSPEGEVQTLKWVEGGKDGAQLADPLGVFVFGDVVYAADTKAVRRFDRKTGKPLPSYEIPTAVRLNDIAAAADGTLYVSDSGSDDAAGALFKITPAGKVSEFVARGPALERPNGVAVMADGTIVHGGRGVNLVFRDKAGKILREYTLPTGQMDGIIPLADGSLLVASQLGHNVYKVPADGGKAVVVAKDIEIPAAIGFDSKRNRLVIPQIRAASLTLVDLP